MPKGFIAHDDGECLVAEDAYIETIIRTAEGSGSGGVTRAKMHVWSYVAMDAEEGLGEVLGYRLAERGGEAMVDPVARFSLKTGKSIAA